MSVRTWEFHRPTAILNTVTGQWIEGDFEIHRDDTQWLLDTWQETFLLAWKINVAIHEWHVQRSPECRTTHTMSCLLSGVLLRPPMSTWP